MPKTKKITLNKKFKAKWLNALRSGKYAQTTETLMDNNGFCCLGVACAVAGIPLKQIEDVGVPSELSEKNQMKLPPFFRNPDYSKGKDCEKVINECTQMNDTKKMTFKQIAARLEKLC